MGEVQLAEVVIPSSMVTIPMTGLNPLIALSAFQVKQQTEMLEAALNAVSIDYEGANKYKVLDPAGNEMYFVAEESECCMRQCCNPNHTMTLHVTDMQGAKVMTMARPWTYNCCCCLLGNMCGQSKMDVFMGGDVEDDNSRIGSVQMPTCGGGFKPTLEIKDRSEAVVARVVGPCCCISDLCGASFEVTGADGASYGEVKKLGVDSMEGAVKEALTDADNFQITFPQTVPVEIKALMMGSLLLLDYMFFESEGAFEFDPFSCTCKFKLCDMFCLGCICPCTCNCGGGDADLEGAPPAPDTQVGAPLELTDAAPASLEMQARA